jgi:dienelactone hydrolase
MGCATGRIASIEPHTIAVSLPQPATLSAELYRPSGPGPFAAVIVLHGCNGVGPNMHVWAQWLRAEGYAALVLDSFGGRGIRRLCGDPSPLLWGARAPDVYAAAAYLESLPYIAGEAIAAVGFSHGGGTVLWAAASASRFPGTPLRAFVAFYPPCGGGLGAYRGSVPVLMLLGAKDDWARPGPCQAIAEEARQAGRPVTAIVYPEARHAFDARGIQGVVVVPDARRGEGATIAYDPRAHADAEKQVREFLRRHLSR